VTESLNLLCAQYVASSSPTIDVKHTYVHSG